MSDKNIEIWKIKKLIKALEAARGNGNSMISLIMPPGDEISRVTKMLGDEFQTASNIKGESVLGAITSAQQRLKLYNEVPPNGLVLYAGTIVTYDGKEKKFKIDFEPFEPINASLYLLDNKFHTEALKEWLESVDTIGFIVMDDNETLFGTLCCNNTRKVVHKFTADLPHPDTHTRYEQRLIVRKSEEYVRKAAELATHLFINPATSQPNVSGLILAGPEPDYINYKAILSQFEALHPCLQAKIMSVVDVSDGGENGFNQAIEISSDILGNRKLIQEKHLIGKVLEEISQDPGKYVFGVDDTLKCLEMGAVEILIVWENLDINRYVLKNSTTGEITIKHSNKEQEADHSNFRDAETNAELEVEENMSLIEWFANEYKTFGCTVEFVTNKSEEGSQFCRALGGIVGILRHQLDKPYYDDLPYVDLSDEGENYDTDRWNTESPIRSHEGKKDERQVDLQ